MTQVSAEQVEDILARFGDQRESLIPILQAVQSEFNYLPEDVLREISKTLHVSLSDVYHVATFYNCFSLEPVGKNLVQVCLGTACHVRGAPRVLDRILRELKMGQLGTTPDCQFTIRSVRCIGCCGLAPVLRVNTATHSHMTQGKVRGMLKKYSDGNLRKEPDSKPAEAEDVHA